jgi:hypothetical protein
MGAEPSASADAIAPPTPSSVAHGHVPLIVGLWAGPSPFLAAPIEAPQRPQKIVQDFVFDFGHLALAARWLDVSVRRIAHTEELVKNVPYVRVGSMARLSPADVQNDYTRPILCGQRGLRAVGDSIAPV